MTRQVTNPQELKSPGNSMFQALPPNIPRLDKSKLKNAEQHSRHKDFYYLDADGIDDYTVVQDEGESTKLFDNMFNGMEGTRLPRTNIGNTGGFHDRDADPLGDLFEYGTEDEEWLEEMDE